MTLDFTPGILTDRHMNFDDGWTPLTQDEVADIWPQIITGLGPRAGQQERVKLAERSLSFLPGARFFRLRQKRGLGQATRHMLILADGSTHAVRYSPRLIDELQSRAALSLTHDNLTDYIAFYWRFTEHGRGQRLIDDDQAIAIREADNSLTATGVWRDHTGQHYALRAVIGHDGHVEFLDDQPLPDGASPPRLQ